jgi:hypothetical protein
MDILTILENEWPLIMGAPIIALGGAFILIVATATIAWKVKGSIDDRELRNLYREVRELSAVVRELDARLRKLRGKI